MFKSILVPIDLTDTDLAKPAIATAATLSQTWNGSVRLLNVMPMTPVMLAEYVPADFDAQQRETSQEALAIVARESGIEASRISTAVRQGGIYHEILEEAAAIKMLRQMNERELRDIGLTRSQIEDAVSGPANPDVWRLR